MWRLYIDNQLISDLPEGLDKLTSSLKREENTGVLLYDISLDLTSYGGQDAYSIVYNRWKADKQGETNISLFQRRPDRSYGKVADGVIMHSSIKFKLIEGSMAYKTEDRGFYGLINNNKGIDVAVNSTKSKNGLTVTPPTVRTLKLHKVTNGTYYNDNRRGYLIIDVLKHVMNVITDGKISVSAPMFESGGAYYSTDLTYLLAGGHEIHYHRANPLVFFAISWEKLFSSICKMFNQNGSLQGTLESPIFVIDSQDRFAASQIAYAVPTVPDEISLSTDEKKLYSNVNIGSPRELPDSTTHVGDIFPFTTFKRESFHFEGTNNVDTRLNLEYDIVTSCGIIHDLLENSDDVADGYADDVFIIETFQNAGAFKSIATRSISDADGTTTVHKYNQTLTNQAILSRWTNWLPNTVNSPYPPPPQSITVTAGTEITYPGDGSIYFSNPAYAASGINNLPGFVNAHVNQSQSWLLPLYDDYNQFVYGNRTVSGGDVSNQYGNGTTQGNPVNYANQRFTCVTPALYNIAINSKLSLYRPYWNQIDTIVENYNISIRAIKYDSGNNIISTHTVASTVLTPNRGLQYLITLSGSIDIALIAGQYLKFDAYVNVPVINNGTLMTDYGLYVLQADLSITTKNYIAPAPIIVNPDLYKSMIIELSYPMSLTDYETLRANKEGIIQVPLKDGSIIEGWINNLSFNHTTGVTKFNLMTDGYKIYR